MRQTASHGSVTAIVQQLRNHLADNKNFASIAVFAAPAARRNGRS
jgi:hypothetical protein